MKEKLVAFLQSVELFQCAGAARLAEMERVCTTFAFDGGAAIVSEGDKPKSVYLVKSGRVTMLKRPQARERVFAGSGSFGDFADSRGEIGAEHAADSPGELEPVMALGVGDYFGQHAAEAADGAAAQYVAAEAGCVCVAVPLPLFEMFVANSDKLIGGTVGVNASNNAEVYSLEQHVDEFHGLHEALLAVERENVIRERERALRIALADETDGAFGDDGDDPDAPRPSLEAATQDKTLALLDLTAAFSPELALDDVIERMVAVTLREIFAGCGRVSVILSAGSSRSTVGALLGGGFVAGEEVAAADANGLVVRCSQGGGPDAHVPVPGLCIEVIRTGEAVNVPDARKDARSLAAGGETDGETDDRFAAEPTAASPKEVMVAPICPSDRRAARRGAGAQLGGRRAVLARGPRAALHGRRAARAGSAPAGGRDEGPRAHAEPRAAQLLPVPAARRAAHGRLLRGRGRRQGAPRRGRREQRRDRARDARARGRAALWRRGEQRDLAAERADAQRRRRALRRRGRRGHPHGQV